MVSVGNNLKGYGKMRRFLIKVAFICLSIFAANFASAEDVFNIKSRLSTDGSEVEVKVLGSDGDFYNLGIFINGRLRVSNNKFVPNESFRNDGGQHIFRGIAIVDDHIVLSFYICGPSTVVCLDRKVFISLLDVSPMVAREETVAFSGELSVRGIFYKNPKIPFNAIDYMHFLKSDDQAREKFSRVYGSCLASIGRDSLDVIVNELEKAQPSSWLSERNCITPQLVMALDSNGELSKHAVNSYLQRLILVGDN